MSMLDTLRSSITRPLEDVVRVFDEELQSEFPFVRDLALRASGYRGKMLRPTLLLLSAQATGQIGREHVVLAAVIEMVHVATLVHDDVLDEADLRRHEPTISRMSGNEAAVLLGDYLISHAYHLCSSLDSAGASRRIAAATNRVCEGELMQVHHRGDWDMSEGTYLEIIRRKTAELTRVACELGAEYAGAEAETVRKMAQYGEDVGIAFQIMDDLLDITGSEDQIGKTAGRDAELAKPTLPIIHARARALERDGGDFTAALAGERVRDRERLRELLIAHGGIDSARETARRFVRSALGRLAEVPASAARQALVAAAEFVTERRN